MSNQELEVESTDSAIIESPSKQKSYTWLFWAFIGVVVVLGIVVGYYFLGHSMNNQAQAVQSSMDANREHHSDVTRLLDDALYQKERELEGFVYSSREDPNTLQKLRYTIRPKQQVITECFVMEVGKWEIPKSCLLSIAIKVDKELQEDRRVVAFEVQGIVDTNPYRGLSPELKQEGLASFRAWNAIRAIEAKIPNVVVFEGPSLQLKEKRGYTIKAYFVD